MLQYLIVSAIFSQILTNIYLIIMYGDNVLKNKKICSLSNRYIPALILIVIFSVLSFLNVTVLLDAIKEDGKIINISGQQRMLSQKLVLLSINYSQKPTIHNKQRIINNLNIMKESHKFLKQNIFNQKLENLFYKKRINKKIHNYFDIYDQLLSDYKSVDLDFLRQESIQLIPLLSSIVNEYEKINKDKITQIIHTQGYILLLTLIILALESIFIFYPASQKIKQHDENLYKKLENTNFAFEQSIKILRENVFYSRTDLNGRIIEISDAFCIQNQYTKEELIGKPHTIIGHRDMEKDIFKDMWQTISKGNIWRGNIKNVKKDGTAYWVDTTISPEYTQDGKIKDYIAVRHDITDKINLDKLTHELELKTLEVATESMKVHSLNINLEKKVKEEVEKNSKKDMQLFEQAKLASMGEMIANIAHQWRQPLAAISVAASGIKLNYELELVEEEELFEQLDTIIDSTEFLSNTINDFQNFLSKDRVKEDFNIVDSIKQVLKIIEGNLKKEKIVVIENYNANLLVHGFKNESIQAILNIVNNAKDALESKKHQKVILIESYIDRQKNIVLKIQDNAGGISENIIDNIFEPYFTTKHKSQGTGLGLYMTHQIIVGHMNGKLEVANKNLSYNNETYMGAEFKITLPSA